MSLVTVLAEIEAERARQDEKWGQQNHEPHIWLAILTEEVGEVAKEIADGLCLGGDWDWQNYRTELVQATAVGVAALEAFDRGLWRE